MVVDEDGEMKTQIFENHQMKDFFHLGRIDATMDIIHPWTIERYKTQLGSVANEIVKNKSSLLLCVSCHENFSQISPMENQYMSMRGYTGVCGKIVLHAIEMYPDITRGINARKIFPVEDAIEIARIINTFEAF